MVSVAQLSSGCLEQIMKGEEIHKPVLQILGSKRINAGTDANERYRLLVSDGKYLQSFAMLATQMNDLYHQGRLCENTVVRIDRYITSVVNRSEKGERRVLIILELTILNHGEEVGERIGSPVNLDTTTSGTTTTQGNSISNGSNYATTAPVARPETTSFGSNSNAFGSSNFNNNTSIASSDDLSTMTTYPISSLTPYQNKWIIKARIMSKSSIRTWNNAKGEGKLFSMDMMDESGEIRATAFKDQCDKFYDMIQVDKVFYISRGQIKVANKQYSTLKHDYELTFTHETVVQECTDTKEVPQIHYNFVPILQIGNMEPGSIVDVLGVCKEASDLQMFTAKTTGRELKKREVTLVDNSGASINLTLWNVEAENFDQTIQPVILLKNAKVTEFGGGKSLSVSAGGAMKLNPDLPEGHKLRGWFDNGGSEKEAPSVSARTGTATSYNTEWLSFEEVKLKNLGIGDSADYFQLKGMIHLAKSTNVIYKACPQPDCNRKVVDQDNGQYRCEKCNSDFPNYKFRLLLQVCIADSTSNNWATCFNELGEQLMNKTSQEIGEAIEADGEIANTIFTSIYFKQYIFKLRTKLEYYSDSPRNKMIVVSATPVDHEDYQNYLIKELQQLTGIGKN